MAADWKKIRNDYITGNYSHRELADMYGISASSVEKRAAREKWSATKDKILQDTCKKIEEKTTEKIVESESNANATLSSIREKLLSKIAEAVESMKGLDTNEIRKLVQCYKDMAEVRSLGEEEKTGALNDILEAVKGVGND